MNSLSQDAQEAIQDLQEIARASSDSREGEDDREVEEAAYVEISEYVRVVTLMLQEEFRGPGTNDRIH